MKGLQAAFAGLAILGILIVAVGLIIDDVAYWDIADMVTMSIFAACAVMFGINFKKYD